MDGNFWKILGTLFGIGAMVSFAKSLKTKAPWNDVLSECIITGFLSTGAALLYIQFPTVSPIAIMGGGAVLAVLGVQFFSDRLSAVLDKFSKKDS